MLNYNVNPRSVKTRKVLRAQLSSGLVIARNPRLALKEARAAIHYAIVDDLAVVKQHGVPVYVIQAPHDELFDASTISHGHANIGAPDGTLLSIADRNAPHDTFWLHPERTVEIIDTIIGSFKEDKLG